MDPLETFFFHFSTSFSPKLYAVWKKMKEKGLVGKKSLRHTSRSPQYFTCLVSLITKSCWRSGFLREESKFLSFSRCTIDVFKRVLCFFHDVDKVYSHFIWIFLPWKCFWIVYLKRETRENAWGEMGGLPHT